MRIRSSPARMSSTTFKACKAVSTITTSKSAAAASTTTVHGCRVPTILMHDMLTCGTWFAWSSLPAAYSLEDWHGMDRYHFNALVTPQDFNDTYAPCSAVGARS